jgi:transcriptional regulator with PAS, ATPase and Fis domain
VLEERKVVPVGDTHPRPIDVRFIAATNRDLQKMVDEGSFREDLHFRLNVVTLLLPPLRQRREDIPLLVQHFLDKYMKEMNKRVNGVSNGAMRALLNHNWRGNVRELENVIERAVIFSEDRQIGVEDLPFTVEGMTNDVSEDLKEAVRQFERQHILFSLGKHNYDKTQTAQSLGIGVSSLYRKLDELQIPAAPEPRNPE